MNQEFELNNKVRLARVEKDLSQSELADKVGSSRQAIGSIENKTFNPSTRLALMICKVLNKKFDDIFFLEVKK